LGVGRARRRKQASARPPTRARALRPPSLPPSLPRSIALSEFVSRFQIIFTRLRATAAPVDSSLSAHSSSAPSALASPASLGSPHAGAGSLASPVSPRQLAVGDALRAEALEYGLVQPADGEAAGGGGAGGVGSPLPPLPEDETQSGWLQAALCRIGEALVSTGDHGSNGAAVFAAIDANGDGSLSLDEFAAAIASLRLAPPLDDEQVKAIFDAVDLNTSGTINYHEFVQGA